jgi:hypothetical protein
MSCLSDAKTVLMIANAPRGRVQKTACNGLQVGCARAAAPYAMWVLVWTEGSRMLVAAHARES